MTKLEQAAAEFRAADKWNSKCGGAVMEAQARLDEAKRILHASWEARRVALENMCVAADGTYIEGDGIIRVVP